MSCSCNKQCSAFFLMNNRSSKQCDHSTEEPHYAVIMIKLLYCISCCVTCHMVSLLMFTFNLAFKCKHSKDMAIYLLLIFKILISPSCVFSSSPFSCLRLIFCSAMYAVIPSHPASPSSLIHSCLGLV